MTLTRISPKGLTFKLYSYEGGKTLVKLGNKSCLLDMHIDDVSQCWYNWQMKGQFIQNAFRDLPAEQREFLISGITPDEWKTLFGDDKVYGENEK